MILRSGFGWIECSEGKMELYSVDGEIHRGRIRVYMSGYIKDIHMDGDYLIQESQNIQ